MKQLSERQRGLRDAFIEGRGYWNEFWDGLLVLDPDFFESYLQFSAVPWKTGTLDPKVKEFIYIAVDAATTHLYEPGLRQHIRNAIGYGATKEEILEVYQLVSVLGMHTCTVGVPVLIQELESAGVTFPAECDLSDRQRALRDAFVEARGYWNEFWDGLLVLDPDFFESYLQFSAVPWKTGTLGPKVKEFIYIAVDAATTHLYEPGLRQHIRNAIGYGATKEEILEVYQLVSVLGMHTCTVGVPVLIEEFERTETPRSVTGTGL